MKSDSRERILHAASAVLRERGYAATSTNEIAARAKVSKRELYAEFGTKIGILEASIAARAERMRRPLERVSVGDGADFAAALRDFGVTFLGELLDPAVVSMFRLAIASAEQAPEVPRALNETARLPTRRALVGLMRSARAAGVVTGGDAPALAGRFFSLLGGLQLPLLLGIAPTPTARKIARHVDRAVAAFLQLHGASPPAPPR